MSREHLVRPGDCIASLAATCGVSVATIWDHPDNAALRQRRASPHQLMPGDVVRPQLSKASRESASVRVSDQHERAVNAVALKRDAQLCDLGIQASGAEQWRRALTVTGPVVAHDGGVLCDLPEYAIEGGHAVKPP